MTLDDMIRVHLALTVLALGLVLLLIPALTATDLVRRVVSAGAWRLVALPVAMLGLQGAIWLHPFGPLNGGDAFFAGAIQAFWQGVVSASAAVGLLLARQLRPEGPRPQNWCTLRTVVPAFTLMVVGCLGPVLPLIVSVFGTLLLALATVLAGRGGSSRMEAAKAPLAGFLLASAISFSVMLTLLGLRGDPLSWIGVLPIGVVGLWLMAVRQWPSPLLPVLALLPLGTIVLAYGADALWGIGSLNLPTNPGRSDPQDLRCLRVGPTSERWVWEEGDCDRLGLAADLPSTLIHSGDILALADGTLLYLDVEGRSPTVTLGDDPALWQARWDARTPWQTVLAFVPPDHIEEATIWCRDRPTCYPVHEVRWDGVWRLDGVEMTRAELMGALAAQPPARMVVVRPDPDVTVQDVVDVCQALDARKCDVLAQPAI